MLEIIEKIKTLFSIWVINPSSKQFLRQAVSQARKETFAAENTLSDVYWEKENLEAEIALLKEKTNALLVLLSPYLATCDAEKLYRTIAPVIDPEGSLLLKEGEKIFGKFNWDAHVKKEFDGVFDYMTARDYFGYIVSDAAELDGNDPDFSERVTQAYVNTLVTVGLFSREFYKIPEKKLAVIRCNELTSDEQAEELYQNNFRRVDAGGFALFRTAEELLGKLCYSTFPYEESRGFFECSNGFSLLRYLFVQEDVQLGDIREQNRWEEVPGTHVERCVDFSIDETAKEYLSFKAKLYREACRNLGLLWDKAELEKELEVRKENKDEEMPWIIGAFAALSPYADKEIVEALLG